MKTHTIQRLRQVENVPQCVVGDLPQPSPLSTGGIKTPPGPLSGSNSASVARAVTLTMESEDEIKRLQAELDAAWKLDALKINKEVQRLNTLLRQMRQEVAQVHDELYALGKPGDGILTRLANRLAAIVCRKEVS